MARSLDEVKKAHGARDFAAEMRVALASIPEGKYETSRELASRTRISTALMAQMREKFSAHAVDITRNKSKPAVLWARTPAEAKKLRDALESQNG